MNISKIYSQLIAFTKEIFFYPKDIEIAISFQFIPGDIPFNQVIGIATKWYYTKKAVRLCKNIAQMSIGFDNNLRYSDYDDLINIVNDTLQRNALNKEIFDIYKNNTKTLFECRNIPNVQSFAKKLWHIIYNSMINSMTKWLILYPLPGIITNSFDLNYDDLHIIKSDDASYWKKFYNDYPYLKIWNPVNCKTLEGHRFYNDIDLPETWVVCEILSTQNRSRFFASLIIRRFIAVLFAFLFEININYTQKSMRKVSSYSIQFPYKDSEVNSRQSFAPIGNLMLPIAGEIILEKDLVNNIRNWYDLYNKLNKEYAQRVSKAANFLNYALVSSGIEQYIFYFIVLDALFGIRNNVEDSIKSSIDEYLPGSNWVQKIDKLFDLRSELVHGGSSYIREWPMYDSYVNHFGSNPINDVEYAAMSCLRQYCFHEKHINKKLIH